MEKIRRCIFEMVAGIALALTALAGLLWYSSLERHIPSDWGRAYVGSNCTPSDFTVSIATQLGTDRPLATIPIDDGDIAPAACRHTRDLLADSNLVWRPLRLLPDSLVCSRLTLAGWTFMQDRKTPQWPVFVGADAEATGATIEGLRSAGIQITAEEFQMFVRSYGIEKDIDMHRSAASGLQ